jgi:hypothetical protein
MLELSATAAVPPATVLGVPSAKMAFSSENQCLMFKKFIFSLLVCSILAACASDSTDLSSLEPVGVRPKMQEGAKPTDALSSVAVPDADMYGKVKWCLAALQEEYDKANGKVPGIGKVTVLLDKNLNVVIRNEGDGSEKKVNMKDLESDPKKYEFIVDGVSGDFPGVKIPVMEGKPKVEISKNGGSAEKVEKLEIILADRESVERFLTSFLQAVQILQGKIAG